MAGKKWLKLFLKCHKPKLSLRKPTGISFARPFGFSKQNAMDYLPTQQDAVKDGCKINATPTKSSSLSKQPSMKEARPPVNSFILTETSFTPRKDTEPSTSRLAGSTLNQVSPYDISPVPDEKRKIYKK
ncbi:hypothetical protein HHI36_023319 [Cryptolaemus montrouzieri]|uniref:Uncharacterized protein n=1 Tax=Cryptolaemus montrouzieri TaxID=559131 RepID=A0ABD2PG24_9CUCU